MRKLWQRFIYRDAVMLEAQRQNAVYGLQEDWADEYSRLIDDDAVATVIQVIHFFLLGYILACGFRPSACILYESDLRTCI